MFNFIPFLCIWVPLGNCFNGKSTISPPESTEPFANVNRFISVFSGRLLHGQLLSETHIDIRKNENNPSFLPAIFCGVSKTNKPACLITTICRLKQNMLKVAEPLVKHVKETSHKILFDSL